MQKPSGRELPSIRCRASITAAWSRNKGHRGRTVTTPGSSSPMETASMLLQGFKIHPSKVKRFHSILQGSSAFFKEPCCTKAWSHQMQFQKKVFCRFFHFYLAMSWHCFSHILQICKHATLGHTACNCLVVIALCNWSCFSQPHKGGIILDTVIFIVGNSPEAQIY